MPVSFPQALFSSPGMLSLFVGIVVLQILSLIFLVLASYEYKQMMRRHALFLQAVSGEAEHRKVERMPRIIFGIYIATTIAVTVLAMLLFLFQPHIL